MGAIQPSVFVSDLTHETIQSLLEIAWWNWESEKITRNLEKIVSADIEALINCK